MKLVPLLLAAVLVLAGCGDEPPREITEDPDQAETPTQPDD